jgi:hypothetical protein
MWLRARDRDTEAAPGGQLAATAALAVSATIFPMFFQAWETRHLAEAAPAFLAMAVLGVAWSVRVASKQSWFPVVTQRMANAIMVATTAALVGWNLVNLTVQHPSGYAELAQNLVGGGKPKVMVVEASAPGEGALVVEVAKRESRPTSYVLRATKTLAEMDLLGRNERERFSSVADMQGFLAGLPVDVVVLDQRQPAPFAYTAKLRRAVTQDAEHWRMRPAGGRFEIFERVHSVEMNAEQVQRILREVGAPPTEGPTR